MKKCYSFLLAALLFSVPALANIVIVKGHITYSNGAPAANHAVWISTDSTSTPPACMQGSMVHTNANGYYIDTLYCTSGNIVKVRIQTQNCNGTWLVETPQVNTSTNLVERNFTLCTPTPAPCQANFNYHFIQNMTVQFTSLSIPTGGSSGLPPHYWNFGDGGTGTGLYPVHTYTAPGTYVVKLIISGVSCADTISRTIQVTNITGTCNATFQDSVINNKLFVFSGGSTTAPGDSIIQRLWNFGDGTGNNNNWANADHIYTAAGTYTVCLRITTALGCNDSVCRTIVVGSPTANCVSNFSYLRTNSAPLTIAFNSSSSAGTTPADAIISRTWTFGDGSPALTGNNVYPSHTYPSIGNYQACLKITTASGCQKTICKTVSVYDSSCHANFNYNIGTGGVVYFNNTSSTLGTTAQYQWMFGNGTTSTAINPVKTYSPGTYTVCLVMWSASGCVDSVCKVITIAPPPPTTNCEAVFQYVGLPPSAGSAGYTLQFGSGASHGTTSTDSIIQRTWYWDDGMMTNGLVSPTHTYMMPGVYNVCLVITSASGCSDTTCKTIAVPMQNQLVCQSYFTYEHLPTTSAATRAIRFNSTMSHGGPADSITSRKWEFGDGTILTGNVVNPIHQYATPGTYNVCLTVKTALNCEKKICKLVVIPQVAGACVPHFSWQRTAPKQVSFNSSTSWVPVGDSIVERKWNFGDATPLLTGNVIAPVHNYLNTGVYTVSLKIKTAQNCEKTYYAPVVVQDSSITPPTTDPIKILSIFPNPAVSQTQTVVWSLHNNVQAEIAVYDIYGVKKWFVNKLLLQGNNITVVPTSLLLPGPYYLRVTTMYGVKSRIFFKQ